MKLTIDVSKQFGPVTVLSGDTEFVVELENVPDDKVEVIRDLQGHIDALQEQRARLDEEVLEVSKSRRELQVRVNCNANVDVVNVQVGRIQNALRELMQSCSDKPVQKIHLIKLVWAWTNFGLKESRDLVDTVSPVFEPAKMVPPPVEVSAPTAVGIGACCCAWQ